MSGSFKVIGATSYRTFRIVWMLEELGINYQHVVTHPRTKLAQQYHPLGKVPVLIHDLPESKETVTLWETGAILTYLGDVHQKLVPTQLPRPKFDQTMYTLMTELDASSLWLHRKHDSLGKVFGQASPEILLEAKRTFDVSNHVFIQQLNPYLLGIEFGVADILYVHLLDWAQAIGWTTNNVDSQEAQALSHYLELCHSRPAYKRTVEKRNQERKLEKEKKVAKQREQQGKTANL